jgi:hypothetical protein
MDPLNLSKVSTSAQLEDPNDHRAISIQLFVEAQRPTTVQSSDSHSCNGSSTLQLDMLPLEIIRRIASHASCKVILALQRVCRVLHHACSDIFIMKHILDRSSIQTRDSARVSRPAWYSRVLSHETPFPSWAWYALAHEEMEQLITNVEECCWNIRLRQRRIISWLPQLLALHCKGNLGLAG